MKRVFISQPMSGLNDEDILNKRNNIKLMLEQLGYGVIDSFIRDKNKTPIELLGMSIELMSQADIIYFVHGWQNSRGCKIERQVAEAYNKDIMEE